jgi:mono/diheme cytochrome c family protein
LYSPPNPSNPDGHTPHLLVGNEVTGQWMRNSGLDNPKFLARTIGDWLASWRGPRPALKSYAEATPLTLDRGEYTFKSHCAACHTVGHGTLIGPDLRGVTKARDRAWLARFILAPDKMLADGDPIAKDLFDKYQNVRMPDLALSREDVAAIIDYLVERDSAAGSGSTSDEAPRITASLAAIVQPYLRIQEALGSDSRIGIAEAARSIASQAANAGVNAASIRSAAGVLQQAADLNSARAAFSALSDAIIAFAKASNATLGDGVHVAYCPMLRKYWLQKGTAIRNPYYGTQMLDCGRITSDLSRY